MKQAVVKKGKVIAQNVATPNVSKGSILIKVHYSCISAGTEMTSVNTTKKSLIKRAIDSPEEVKEVLDFVKVNGIQKTIQKVRGVIDGGKQTGYSVAGEVIAIGAGIENFQIGDKVAAAGAGIANHAEYVDVPTNLVMKMPNGLDYKLASTVTMGGIAMQGVRRADLRFGESCVVVGAGILGLLALQMLKLSGVRVIVTDLDEHRLALAKELGADLCINPTKEDAVKVSNSFSGGYGVDCVLFTAATSSSKPLSDSFKMCRKKGKVVLVGVVGMEINRGDMYAKELDFQISTSYGPGRYDSNYEEKGLDYPLAYVRWTENRNMTEYLQLLNEGKINIEPLIDGVFGIEKVDEAFASLLVWQDKNGNHNSDVGELVNLAVAGIESLAVDFTELPFIDQQGNLHLERSSATLTDGTAVDMTDVYFNVAMADVQAENAAASSLETLSGYGQDLEPVIVESVATIPGIIDPLLVG